MTRRDAEYRMPAPPTRQAQREAVNRDWVGKVRSAARHSTDPKRTTVGVR
jgi:hypothetical protein